jgi:hypothetical protein
MVILLHQQMPTDHLNPNRSQTEQIVTFGVPHSGGKPKNAERSIKPAAAIRIVLGRETKLNLFASDPRGR